MTVVTPPFIYFTSLNSSESLIDGISAIFSVQAKYPAVAAASWKFSLPFIVIIIISVISYLFYQLVLHPLANYPGPVIGKLTNGYAAYHAYKGDIHLDMLRCHLKYGDYVRYCPDRLLVNTATGMRDIYSNGKNVSKSRGYDAMIHRAPNTLTMRNKIEHARRRRIMSQGLSDSAIRGYQGAILSHVEKFIGYVRDGGNEGDSPHGVGSTSEPSLNWSPARNLSQWCSYLSFDMMSDIVFSLKYDLLGKPDHRYVTRAIDGSNVRTSVLLYAPFLLWRRWDKTLFKESIRHRNVFINFISKIVDHRFKESTTDHRDIFSVLTNAKDPETGKGLDPPEIGGESTTLIVADKKFLTFV